MTILWLLLFSFSAFSSVNDFDFNRFACKWLQSERYTSSCESMGYKVNPNPAPYSVSMIVTHIQGEFKGAELVQKSAENLVRIFESKSLPIGFMIFPGEVSNNTIEPVNFLIKPNSPSTLGQVSGGGESQIRANEKVVVIGGYFGKCHLGTIEDLISRFPQRQFEFHIINDAVFYGLEDEEGEVSDTQTLATLWQKLGNTALLTLFEDFIRNSTGTGTDVEDGGKINLNMKSFAIYLDNKLVRHMGAGKLSGSFKFWSTNEVFQKQALNQFVK